MNLADLIFGKRYREAEEKAFSSLSRFDIVLYRANQVITGFRNDGDFYLANGFYKPSELASSIKHALDRRADYVKFFYGEEFTPILYTALTGITDINKVSEATFNSKIKALIKKRPLSDLEATTLLEIIITPNEKKAELKLRSRIKKLSEKEQNGVGFYAPTPAVMLEDVFGVIEKERDLSDAVVMDVGSGYGHILFYGGLTRPIKKLIGIELSPERVDASKGIAEKLAVPNAEFINCDAINADFSSADVFTFFNPFPEGTLEKVKKSLSKEHGKLIEAHGPCADYLEGEAWVKKVSESAYRSVNLFRIL